jgi:hypothetical protein
MNMIYSVCINDKLVLVDTCGLDGYYGYIWILLLVLYRVPGTRYQVPGTRFLTT